METRLLRLLALGLTTLSLHTASGQALDPGFQFTGFYTPVSTTAAVSQPDGKRLVLGNFARTDAGAASQLLVRYNADNTVDQAFAANVATLRGTFNNVRVLPSGKLLLVGEGTVGLGSLTRQDLLLLNDDGTADATFNAGSASGLGRARVSAVQADGKILLGGTFTNYNGMAAQRIVRLLPTGGVDATFSAGTQLNDVVEDITLQADGKILVGGSFDAPAAIARLLPSGALDPTFNSPLAPSAQVSLIGVQPDGNILLGSASYGNAGLRFTTGSSAVVARLLPSGAPDPAFLGNSSRNGSAVVTNLNDANEFVVQPDGRIVAPLDGTFDGSVVGILARINANGTYDASFMPPFAPEGFVASVNSLQRQANGQLLVAGRSFRISGRRNSVALLNGNGSVDASFNPVLLMAGAIYSVAQQADGKILAGGVFDEVNGIRMASLARFNPDGSLDAAFATQPSLPINVNKVSVQADGKILVGGDEPTVGSFAAQQIIRLLPSGAVDNTFQPASNTQVTQFALQPDGRIIITDYYTVKRLLTNGQVDNTFATGSTDGPVYGLAVQPDGKVLVGGYWDNYNSTAVHALVRLLPSGALDPSFVSPIQSVLAAEADEILVQPDGKIVIGGYVDSSNPVMAPYGLFRLLPDGATDNSFSATVPEANGLRFVRGLALQPNGRILVAAYGNGLTRVLANGQPDLSFGSIGFNTDVEDVLVQPDGKIVVGGYFSTVNGQPTMGLARIMASNVLHVANAQLEARTQAWPVPAHSELHLSLDASAQPHSVQLLDNLGRTVLHQPATQPALTLPLRQVKAGVYLLRVNYANGPVTRRVVVE